MIAAMKSTKQPLNYKALYALLSKHRQQHLLTFYDDLNPKEQEALLEQIREQDWEMLTVLIDRYVKHYSVALDHYDVSPAPYYPKTASQDLVEKYAEAEKLGKSLISKGKVAAFTVAGGQGSRLGWDAPKGTFPATPLSQKSLFQIFAEQLQRAARVYGHEIPWYIMTSPMNDIETRDFFKQHNYFGLTKASIRFFPQGTLPSISTDAQVLLQSKGSLALNPDGHGGSFKALQKSGAILDMKKRGVEYLSYFQVDNPHVKIMDPLFIGLHALDGADMSAKMLPKASASEKVGNFCLIGGKLGIIEYSDMPEELSNARNEQGELLYNAGSIAIHMISLAFAEAITDDPESLPYHRALKKVGFFDIASKRYCEPQEANAIKLERFIFDALALAKNAFILETDRVEEFAPIKNAEGPDSAETSRSLQIERAARWLEQQGCKVPRKAEGTVDAIIELSPLTASCAEDLQALDIPQIKPGDKLIL